MSNLTLSRNKMWKVSFFLSQGSKFLFWTELSNMALVSWYLHMKSGLNNCSFSLRNPEHSLNRESDPVPKITVSPTPCPGNILVKPYEGGIQ